MLHVIYSYTTDLILIPPFTEIRTYAGILEAGDEVRISVQLAKLAKSRKRLKLNLEFNF